MEKVRPKVAIPPPFQGSIGRIGVTFLDQFHIIAVEQGMRNPSNSKVVKLKHTKNCFFRKFQKVGKGLQRMSLSVNSKAICIIDLPGMSKPYPPTFLDTYFPSFQT